MNGPGLSKGAVEHELQRLRNAYNAVGVLRGSDAVRALDLIDDLNHALVEARMQALGLALVANEGGA